MEPYRGAGGGSSTLAALVAEGGAEIPRQSKLLAAAQILERLELAAGVQAQKGRLGFFAGAVFSGMVALIALRVVLEDPHARSGGTAFVLILVAAAIGLGIAAASESARAKRKRDEAVVQLLAWPASLPFPAGGFDEFLVADRPLVDVTLVVEPERRMFVDAARAIDAAIEVEAIGGRRFRLALPPRSQTFTSKHSARLVRFGDRALLQRLFDKMILPLHGESGIERVDFGGTIEERN